MSIGLLVLYAALAVVALWLVAELLLQNRAPLHWRGVALGGFLLVVAGMAIRSVPVIGAGAVAFATGQVFVTLAVKRGTTRSWSLRASDGALPGPLAKVPLLSAATGGEAAVAAVAVPVVGEVGPIEEPEQGILPEPLTEDDFGVYETPGYLQDSPQEEPQPQQQSYPQYGEQQQWQQQPVQGYQDAGYQQGWDGQQGYPQQQQYQDPYWQPQQQQQYQDPAQYQQDYGIPHQQGYEQQHYQQPESWTQQQ
ncbi:hypothetical protein P3T37_004158 [Kitasatospora sp. MAA4]|uniref:hypothetical protein n=1 Tax=Kitasatospora sp. MAA4 TaxID=3035093 RepID=UPI0024763C05|nr:hypothetical protein [Kitasatospora sp. MAA4]MDH6134749.1 hypothetical protein [Kitasatospora sp. MAA4]